MFTEIVHAATEAAPHAAEAASHVAEADTSLLGTFGLDWKLFLAQLVNFSVIVFVLTKWVYKPLIKTMDERKKKIEDGVKNAETAEKKLHSAKDEEEKIINEARAAGKEILDEGKKRGETERQKRVDASKVIIEEQLKESKERITRETEAAKQRAEKDIAGLVIGAAEKVTKTVLDEKTHRKLIQDSIKELETSHG
jgi:F-type H+-transporting ATPase subunit b